MLAKQIDALCFRINTGIKQNHSIEKTIKWKFCLLFSYLFMCIKQSNAL